MIVLRAALLLKKTSQASSDADGEAGAAVKTPKLQRDTKPSSKAPMSDPVEEPERCESM